LRSRTNWGNLGHPGGYTSYDYAAAIAEDRTILQEKYSEVKLQANFLRASPAYLTAVPDHTANGSHVNTAAISTTRLAGNLTSFYVVRHAEVRLSNLNRSSLPSLLRFSIV